MQPHLAADVLKVLVPDLCLVLPLSISRRHQEIRGHHYNKPMQSWTLAKAPEHLHRRLPGRTVLSRILRVHSAVLERKHQSVGAEPPGGICPLWPVYWLGSRGHMLKHRGDTGVCRTDQHVAWSVRRHAGQQTPDPCLGTS